MFRVTVMNAKALGSCSERDGDLEPRSTWFSGWETAKRVRAKEDSG